MDILDEFQSLQQRVLQLKEQVQGIVEKNESTIADLKKYIETLETERDNLREENLRLKLAQTK